MAKQLSRLGIQLSETPLLGVEVLEDVLALGQPLSTRVEHYCDRSTDAGADRESCVDDLDTKHRSIRTGTRYR